MLSQSIPCCQHSSRIASEAFIVSKEFQEWVLLTAKDRVIVGNDGIV